MPQLTKFQKGLCAPMPSRARGCGGRGKHGLQCLPFVAEEKEFGGQKFPLVPNHLTSGGCWGTPKNLLGGRI